MFMLVSPEMFGTATWMPQRLELRLKSPSLLFTTTAGNLVTQNLVKLDEFQLPEFNLNRKVDEVKCQVFDNPQVIYDLILGRDFLPLALMSRAPL